MKKRSAASSRSKPPELPPLFLDASLGKKIVPEALREAGATVHVHDDLFRPGTPDEAWLRRAGTEGWLVVTKDRRIRYRKNEHEAVRRWNVRVVVLISKELTGAGMASLLVAAIPSLRKFIAGNHAPFVAALTRDGRITRLD